MFESLLDESKTAAGPLKKSPVSRRLETVRGIQKIPSREVELFILAEFLSAEECDRIIKAMDGEWKRSSIADDIGQDDFRTSETCQIDSTRSEFAEIEDRIIALTGLDPLHGEPLQGQRYAVGQEFKPHTDYFEPDGPDYQRFCAKTGQRTWTVMMYLNTPEDGGVTFFPRLGMGVKPTAGTLVAWNNIGQDGAPNGATLHHGMPVIKGTKFILTKWFRERPWPWPDVVAGRLSSGRRFDGTRPARPPAARREVAVADAVALRRRDWLLSVKEELHGLVDTAREVPRVRDISADEFLSRYYAPGRPVILEGEMEGWPARQLWSPAYLKRKVGSAPIEYQGGRNGSERYELQKDVHKRSLAFDAYIDLIAGRPGNDAYITANNSNVNRSALECLFDDVRPLPKLLRGAPGMIWIGPIGTFTPLHFDLTNNLIAQVVGSKHFILIPPSETRLLSNHRHVFSAVHDVMDEDRLTTYPLARDAITYELDLEAGELLFIPIGWWHQVTALDFSVSFTHIDFIWRNDFCDSFPAD